jgi:hypothetical protein
MRGASSSARVTAFSLLMSALPSLLRAVFSTRRPCAQLKRRGNADKKRQGDANKRDNNRNSDCRSYPPRESPIH